MDFSQNIVVYLGGGLSNISFNVHPYLGKIPMLTHISQMGWNHQLDIFIFGA